MILEFFFFLNRYDDAIQLYDRILQEDPTNTVSKLNCPEDYLNFGLKSEINSVFKIMEKYT